MNEFRTKAASVEDIDGDQGVVIAKISEFGTVDLLGDIVYKGAFAAPFKSIEQTPIPVYPVHRDRNPLNWPGHVLKGWEDSEGAFIEAQFYLEEAAGSAMFTRLKSGLIPNWSYEARCDPRTTRKNKHGGDDIHHYTMMRECSPAAIGAHPNTGTLKVASAEHLHPSRGENLDRDRALLKLRMAQSQMSLKAIGDTPLSRYLDSRLPSSGRGVIYGRIARRLGRSSDSFMRQIMQGTISGERVPIEVLRAIAEEVPDASLTAMLELLGRERE